MSQEKLIKNQSTRDGKLMREYIAVMKQAPILVHYGHNMSDLRQPSLLEEVDSVTTYEVSATVQE